MRAPTRVSRSGSLERGAERVERGEHHRVGAVPLGRSGQLVAQARLGDAIAIELARLAVLRERLAAAGERAVRTPQTRVTRQERALTALARQRAWRACLALALAIIIAG